MVAVFQISKPARHLILKITFNHEVSMCMQCRCSYVSLTPKLSTITNMKWSKQTTFRALQLLCMGLVIDTDGCGQITKVYCEHLKFDFYTSFSELFDSS